MQRAGDAARIFAWPFRRAFSGSGIAGSYDAQFVKNAMRWYEKEKGRLTLNDTYGEGASGIQPLPRRTIVQAENGPGQWTKEAGRCHCRTNRGRY